MTLTQQLGFISPILYPIVGAFSILTIDLFVSKEHKIKNVYPLIALIFIALSAFSLVQSIQWDTQNAVEPIYVFSKALVLDNLYRIASLFILVALTLLFLFASNYLKHIRVSEGEYYALLFFAVTGMMLMIASNDFITLFFSLEIMSISTYILTGLTRESSRTTEATMKYFIMGAFATSFILYGLTLFYGLSGTIYLHLIAQMIQIENQGMALLAMTLILIGLAFKIGAVPFHMWVPDVYEGAPTAITAFMSVTVKVAGFSVLIRFIWTLFSGMPFSSHLLLYITMATLLIGNLYALTQTSVKRMLAYSSISHTGYALIGLTVFSATRDPQAVSATLYYLFTYTFMTLGAFLFIFYIRTSQKEAELYEDFAGLATERPWSAFAMTVLILSLAGVPPMGGFFSKFYLFQNALHHQFYGLVIFAVFGTMISLYYYLKVIVMMYMKPAKNVGQFKEETPYFGLTLSMALSVLFTVLLGLAPTRFLEWVSAWSVGIIFG